jgi:hypothetical protein
LILLIMVEMFLNCEKGSFSTDATSLDIWINDFIKDPVGIKPEEIMIGGRTTSMASYTIWVEQFLFIFIIKSKLLVTS